MTDDPDNWAELHKEQARSMLRTQLANALGVHLPLMGAEGHLTAEDITRELAGAMMVVMFKSKERTKDESRTEQTR